MEAAIQSFIIKIWLEQESRAGESAVWRGYITHVPSGKRQHIQTLEMIPRFITPYLEQMGVELNSD